MLSQAELKRLRGLQLKKAREDSGLFLVQGRKVVAEVLASAYRVERLLATAEAAAHVAEQAARKQVPVHVLPQLELDKIGTFEKGNELIAITHKPTPPGFAVPGARELVLALDGVRDPRNMGSLLRIADWFGIRRVICSEDCMEVFNPKAVSSTMGSLFRVEVREVASLADELREQAARGVALYLADMDGESAFTAALPLPGILVLGSESHGHSAAVSALQAKVISIPRIGQAESLNVAMAASALCMEFARRALQPGR